jgi:pantetheine-phosphate adenylyltransferase
MKKVVYAGSFDGMTNGHLWMVKQGSKLFDELIVAVGTNPDKKQKYTFSLDERFDMTKRVVRNFPNVKADHFENQYLVRYAKSVGAQYLLRGIRCEEDYEDERDTRYGNRSMDPSIETVFLIPPKSLTEIKSSFVKGMVGYEGWENQVKKRVPRPVYKKFLESFDGNLMQWNSLWNRIGAQGGSKEVYDKLKGLYSEPHRAYHDMMHIADCLEEFEPARRLAEKPDEIEMAIWTHDAIYDTHRKDNEERSAELAIKILRDAKLSNSFINGVKENVLASKHDVFPTDNDTRLFTSIDLVPLGKPTQFFKENEGNIREEFSWAPDEQYRIGRKEFVQRFMERPSIYPHEYFKEKYERRAVRNLESLIKKLSN